MKKILLLLVILFSCGEAEKTSTNDFKTVFEISQGQETATYKETIEYYQSLAETYPEITIEAIGETDAGKPLHLVVLNPKANGQNFETLRASHQILLINNGIHPGESDGIDATMMFFRDLVNDTLTLPKNTILATIPIYNVGGSLNRNTGTRTNQNGPEEYGFRGNAQNYDLNRDFIKSDTKNAQTFAKIFHLVQPDFFIDNHVSNGADYQYTLTHLFTQHNKLGGTLGPYVQNELMPNLEQRLSQKQWDITPYVNVFNRTPESGFSQFMDYPRYSTGYTSLFHSAGLMVETHMLKPYRQRVEGTYELMKTVLDIMETETGKIREMKMAQQNFWRHQNYYPTNWTVDTTKNTTLNFKGFEGTFVESTITGGKQLKYDRTKPFTRAITYSNYFVATDSVSIPKAYLIPQGWHKVIERLRLNNINYTQLSNDTIIQVEAYKIKNFQTRSSPYEGHYGHFDTSVEKRLDSVKFRMGDYLVTTDQTGLRYLMETLEPQAADSFFNWNFFDTILQQKEGFSPYVWEDKAALVLQQNPKLQIDFNLKKTFDCEFASNWYAQLDWIHKNSIHYEKAHMQYPIYRIPK